MDIYIYSDESGVFDYKHNDFYVYGGVIFLSKQERDDCARLYLAKENMIRCNANIKRETEVKACLISNKDKSKMYRTLNRFVKFGTVIRLPKVYADIFGDKKTKQRYLDYAYKIGVKARLQQLIKEGHIIPDDVENIHFFVDEHTTATNGRYELREALEMEFKLGTYNYNYVKKFPPLFPKMKGVELKFCNSSSVTLIRAADIVANQIYHKAQSGTLPSAEVNGLSIKILP